MMRPQFRHIPRMLRATLSKNLQVLKRIARTRGGGPAKACTLTRFVELGTASHARTISG
jgi:hypothetical protein